MKPYCDAEYIYIDTIKSLEHHIQQIQTLNISCLGLNTETTGLNYYTDRLRLIQIAIPDYPVLVIDWFAVASDRARALINSLLGDRTITKIGHYLKFECCFLQVNGIQLVEPLFDTYLVYRTMKAGLKVGLKLEQLAAHFLCVTLNKEQQKSNFAGDLLPEQIQYAANDSRIVLDIRQVLLVNLELFEYRHLHQVFQLENNCLIDIAQIELNGVYVNLER